MVPALVGFYDYEISSQPGAYAGGCEGVRHTPKKDDLKKIGIKEGKNNKIKKIDQNYSSCRLQMGQN